MNLTTEATRRIRGRIAEAGVRRRDVAHMIGYSESMFSLILQGDRTMPPDFEARVYAALDALEEEKRVAAEAVEKLRAERAAQDADGERL